MNDPALPKPGDIVGGKYRVERVLGSGGMGVVFEVTHRVTNKRFAVKWLMPHVAASDGAVKRFIREAQVAGRFEHPNVVEVYDIGQDGDSFFMVMELLSGESLADRLARLRRLSVQQACEILVPCMEGVAAAHDAGIIHRDLKPANIYVCAARGPAPEQSKVLDFGISKLSHLHGVPDATLTRAGAVMGTPHYMAPEQMRAQPVDPRADVYAFGVILYEALSGRRPFDADNYVDLMLQVFNETPKPLAERVPEVPLPLSRVVERAMAREPAERYPNLTELARALAPFYSPPAVHPLVRSAPPASSRPEPSQPAAAPPPPTPLSSESIPSPSPFSTLSHRTQLWLAGAFATALIAALIAAVFSRPDTSSLGTSSATAHRVRPASDALESEAADPRPLVVRVEPEPAEEQPTTAVPIAQEQPAAGAPAPELPPPAAIEPRRPTKRRAPSATKPGFKPRVKLELDEFTSD